MSQFPGPPLEDPPTRPPRVSTGAQLGGARWDDWRTRYHRVRAKQRRGRCDSLPGAADAAKVTADPRASATLRPTTPSAATGAAAEPVRANRGFSGPASGVAGDRGDDLGGVQRTERSGVNGTPVSSSSGRRSRTREGVIVFFLQIDTLAPSNSMSDKHLQNSLFRAPRTFGAD